MDQINYKEKRKERGLKKIFSKLKNLPQIILYLTSTYIISFTSEIIIGYTIIYTLGATTFKTPVMMTVYTALAYIFTFIVLAILPKIILKRKDKHPIESPTKIDEALAG